jgi:hypothetical protein
MAEHSDDTTASDESSTPWRSVPASVEIDPDLGEVTTIDLSSLPLLRNGESLEVEWRWTIEGARAAVRVSQPGVEP